MSVALVSAYSAHNKTSAPKKKKLGKYCRDEEWINGQRRSRLHKEK
jgi:hypothetical protein